MKLFKIKNKNLKDWIKAFFIAAGLFIFFNLFVSGNYIVTSDTMQNSLLQGDFVYINKLAYGARFPFTLLRVPFTNMYSELIQLPYLRVPGFSNIGRNDIVVFNYPIENDPPIDQKIIYAKRCVGLPGDTLVISAKKVFVNNVNIDTTQKLLFNYRITTDGNAPDKHFFDSCGVISFKPAYNNLLFDITCTQACTDSLLKTNKIKNLRELINLRNTNSDITFPQSSYIHWNKDYFGDVIIPQKGDSIELNIKNIDLYKKIIEVYESNELIINGENITINGKTTNTYTFKKNYYFVMDDNRDQAKDSRYWGFLPEDHIIGKASFIWFSIDKTGAFPGNIRWNRIFSVL